MDQRLSLVTLAVADVARSRAFYVDGLGWEPLLEVDDVLMIRVGDRLVLSLWDEAGFEAEVGPVRRGEGHSPLALAHNVATEAEVDAIVRRASAFGAEVRQAQRRAWGGYSAYVFDPDGTPWEIALNPGEELAFLLPSRGGRHARHFRCRPVGMDAWPYADAPSEGDPMPPTDADKQPMTDAEVVAATPEGWNVALDQVLARYETGDFTTGARFVQRIAALADEANHHPDVDLRYPHVTVALQSHDVVALTQRDVALALAIHAVAGELGIAVGQAPDRIEVALDTADHTRLQPFYAALLGYAQPGDVEGSLVDPAGRSVPLWFQASDSSEPDRQRWHLDVTVPPAVAQERIAAVVAAGGTLVDDSQAPAFWVLSDADGNRSCICTWEGRD